MALNLRNLDSRTRELMLEELLIDIEKKVLYLSKRLNDSGILKYPELLRYAIEKGNDNILAQELKNGYLKVTEQRKKPKGGFSVVNVPVNANEMLAEGEFNRFYMRALCSRAIDEGKVLIVYRAKNVTNPRPESQMKIGHTVNPHQLLKDLRENIGTDTALGLPAGPNSGLSVRLG